MHGRDLVGVHGRPDDRGEGDGGDEQAGARLREGGSERGERPEVAALCGRRVRGGGASRHDRRAGGEGDGKAPSEDHLGGTPPEPVDRQGGEGEVDRRGQPAEKGQRRVGAGVGASPSSDHDHDGDVVERERPDHAGARSPEPHEPGRTWSGRGRREQAGSHRCSAEQHEASAEAVDDGSRGKGAEPAEHEAQRVGRSQGAEGPSGVGVDGFDEDAERVEGAAVGGDGRHPEHQHDPVEGACWCR